MDQGKNMAGQGSENDKQPLVKVILVDNKIKLLIDGEEVNLDGASLLNSKTKSLTHCDPEMPESSIEPKKGKSEKSDDSGNSPEESKSLKAKILMEPDQKVSSVKEDEPIHGDKQLNIEDTSSNKEISPFTNFGDSDKGCSQDIINNNVEHKIQETDKIETTNKEICCDQTFHEDDVLDSTEIKQCNDQSCSNEGIYKDCAKKILCNDLSCDNQEQKKRKRKKNRKGRKPEEIVNVVEITKLPEQPKPIKTPKYLKNLLGKLTGERTIIGKGENLMKKNAEIEHVIQEVKNNVEIEEGRKEIKKNGEAKGISQNAKKLLTIDKYKNDLTILDTSKGLKKLTFTSCENHKSIVLQLCENLQEENKDWIENSLTYLGVEKTMEIYERTREKERNGGILVKDGTRRKTPGGVFISMLQSDNSIEKDIYKKIFEQTATNSKRTKCIETKKRQWKQNQELKEQLQKEGLL